MAFNATYDSGDITEATQDGLARGAIVAASLTGVVVLVIVGVWAYKKFK